MRTYSRLPVWYAPFSWHGLQVVGNERTQDRWQWLGSPVGEWPKEATVDDFSVFSLWTKDCKDQYGSIHFPSATRGVKAAAKNGSIRFWGWWLWLIPNSLVVKTVQRSLSSCQWQSDCDSQAALESQGTFEISQSVGKCWQLRHFRLTSERIIRRTPKFPTSRDVIHWLWSLVPMVFEPLSAYFSPW